MPQCRFYTAKFNRCTNGAGGDYCGVHRAKAQRLGARPADHLCHCVRFIDGHDQWCGGMRLEGQELCEWHHLRRTGREEREERERLEALRITMEIQRYVDHPDRLTWQAVARDCRRRTTLHPNDPEYLRDMVGLRVARGAFIRLADVANRWVFTDFWVNLWREMHGLPPMEVDEDVPQADPREMARFAQDAQNVHTRVVTKQTNDNLAILLEEEPFEGQDTLRTLTGWWVFHPKPNFETYWQVIQDVHHWYNARTCKKANDRLYQRALDGLVVKILLATDGEGAEKDELFKELSKRLWEECEESVGMCCEGHLARLGNVLVGFDEAFKPPVPKGELLQEKMAAIAAMSLTVEEKQLLAALAMNELDIPMGERAPWMEALE